MQPNLVIIRHGQSKFNLEKRFAGWIDTDLTKEGERQAEVARQELAIAGFNPEVIFTSPFTRAKRTAQIIFPNRELKEDARLVERFYGGLSGKSKEETLKEIGAEEYQKIRRGYETAPPTITKDHREHGLIMEVFNKWIKGTFAHKLPATESLQQVETRLKPFFDSSLAPLLKAGKKVAIVAHGNSLRALVKLLKNLSPAEIADVELETAQPAGFVIDKDLNVTADSLGRHFAEVFKSSA